MWQEVRRAVEYCCRGKNAALALFRARKASPTFPVTWFGWAGAESRVLNASVE